MKKRRNFTFLIVIIAASLLLTACTGGSLAGTSWPGVTLAQDKVYVAYGAFVAAVNLKDGSMAWRHPADKAENGVSYYAAPQLVDNQLIVGDFNGGLHSLDPGGGTEKWKFSTGTVSHFVGPVLGLGNLILAPASDHYVYAVDPQGKLSWKFQTGQGIWAQPAADKDHIYLASLDHYLYALPLTGGNPVWKSSIVSAVVSGPVLGSDGNLYLGTIGKEVLAVNAANGKVVWRYTTADAIWSQPALADGVIYIGDLSGSVYAIDQKSGALKWKVDMGSAVIASAAISSKGIVAVSEGGSVVLVSSDGQKVWTRSINGKLYTTPAVNADKIVIGVTSGEQVLVAFDLQGNQLWTFAFPK
jgi:outer membrane protein assembly factor BamB